MDTAGSKEKNLVTGAFLEGSNVNVQFRGINNQLHIGPNVLFRSGTINFRGNNQIVRLDGDNILLGELHLSGDRSEIHVGSGTKCNSPIWMNLGEPDDKVSIGQNCLFANVRFRTSDSHPIYDEATDQRINPSKSITLGDRVWVAEDVLILKGAVIEAGSAVGARSLVVGHIPGKCIAVGVPAKVVRQNIRWEEKFRR